MCSSSGFLATPKIFDPHTWHFLSDGHPQHAACRRRDARVVSVINPWAVLAPNTTALWHGFALCLTARLAATRRVGSCGDCPPERLLAPHFSPFETPSPAASLLQFPARAATLGSLTWQRRAIAALAPSFHCPRLPWAVAWCGGAHLGICSVGLTCSDSLLGCCGQ